MRGFLSITPLLLAASSLCSSSGFAFLEPYHRNNSMGNDSDAGSSKVVAWDYKQGPEPNFHVVAQRLGKTALRPGGSKVSKELQSRAKICPGDTVLELSAGLGRSGIELARRYGAQVTLTDIDTSRLEKAAQRVDDLGLSDLIDCKTVDMFNIDRDLGLEAKFNVAQTEASLTHYPFSRKAKFFKDIAKHADKFLLHEVCFRTNDEERQEQTRKDMSKVLNIGFFPETPETWQKLLSDAGYEIEFVSTGDVAILNPMSLINDEGLVGFAKILANAAAEPYLRSRMLATRGAIARHSSDLGFIAIIASKN